VIPRAVADPVLTDMVSTVLGMLGSFEAASRRMHPMAIPMLRERLLSEAGRLDTACRHLQERGLPDDDAAGRTLLKAGGLIVEAAGVFGEGRDMTQAFMSVLRSFRKCCQAQEALFALCHEFPAIDRFFLEPGVEVLGRENGVGSPGTGGVIHRIPGQDSYGRGGYSLYVPEAYAPGHVWPLVIALHGGYGHGRDFLWTWLRESRSRGFLLLAPTSSGKTWSLGDIEEDGAAVHRHLDEVCSLYTVDRSRILLTGMSDGGTFALGFGLRRESPAAAVAPVSCVLPPVDLSHAGGRRILWVHGAQDWMFPVARASRACEALSRAGADVRLRIVPDLSHAYPREENDAILKWFDPGAGLFPGAGER